MFAARDVQIASRLIQSRCRLTAWSLAKSQRVGQPQITTRSKADTSSSYVLAPKYANFAKIQAERPLFDATTPTKVSQPPNPDWKYGDPASSSALENSDKHVEIDPYEEGRPMMSNYTLLISAIPRPISFISTISKGGTKNLAPFSYFQIVDHDPPIFVVGFTARPDRLKDTRKNLVETGECVIGIVSEHIIHGVNAASLDMPVGDSEWALSGFSEAASSTVKPARVKEAVVSIEGKLLEMKSLDYGSLKGKSGKPSGALAIIQATRFWVKEDAIDDNRTEVDLNSLRPLVQLGGMSYGRVGEIFELPRPNVKRELENENSGLGEFLKQTGR